MGASVDTDPPLLALDELSALATDEQRNRLHGGRARLAAQRLRVLVAGEAKRVVASIRSRIDQDQGAPNPVGSPASRRGTGGSIAHERVLSQIAPPSTLPVALPGPAHEPRPGPA